MIAVIVTLAFVAVVAVAFWWLGVIEERIEAERAAEMERHVAEAMAVAAACHDFDKWAKEMSA